MHSTRNLITAAGTLLGLLLIVLGALIDPPISGSSAFIGGGISILALTLIVRFSLRNSDDHTSGEAR